MAPALSYGSALSFDEIEFSMQCSIEMGETNFLGSLPHDSYIFVASLSF